MTLELYALLPAKCTLLPSFDAIDLREGCSSAMVFTIASDQNVSNDKTALINRNYIYADD